jgi:hypothetical protein
VGEGTQSKLPSKEEVNSKYLVELQLIKNMLGVGVGGNKEGRSKRAWSCGLLCLVVFGCNFWMGGGGHCNAIGSSIWMDDGVV